MKFYLFILLSLVLSGCLSLPKVVEQSKQKSYMDNIKETTNNIRKNKDLQEMKSEAIKLFRGDKK